MTNAIPPVDTVDPLAAYRQTTGPPDRSDQFGKDTFLKLLVAQLRYQDPTNPTDGAEFLSQSAQFSVVEKLEELAKTNTELLAAERMTTATSMIGRSVTYTSTGGTEATGVVTATRTGPMGPVLVVGNDEIPLGSVTAVRAAPAPKEPAAQAPTGTATAQA
jgi:flagellar basal-body rod modification protein FlgD